MINSILFGILIGAVAGSIFALMIDVARIGNSTRDIARSLRGIRSHLDRAEVRRSFTGVGAPRDNGTSFYTSTTAQDD